MEDEILNEEIFFDEDIDANEIPGEPNICDCGECEECIKLTGECGCGDCDVCIKRDADAEIEAEDLYDDIEPEDLI